MVNVELFKIFESLDPDHFCSLVEVQFEFEYSIAGKDIILSIFSSVQPMYVRRSNFVLYSLIQNMHVE